MIGAVYSAGIYNARETEGSPGDRNGNITHRIIDDLVPAEQV